MIPSHEKERKRERKREKNALWSVDGQLISMVYNLLIFAGDTFFFEMRISNHWSGFRRHFHIDTRTLKTIEPMQGNSKLWIMKLFLLKFMNLKRRKSNWLKIWWEIKHENSFDARLLLFWIEYLRIWAESATSIPEKISIRINWLSSSEIKIIMPTIAFEKVSVICTPFDKEEEKTRMR